MNKSPSPFQSKYTAPATDTKNQPKDTTNKDKKKEKRSGKRVG